MLTRRRRPNQSLKNALAHITGRPPRVPERNLIPSGWSDRDSKRAVVFLDPYGMEVEGQTLQALARTQAIDVWFLFPLAGLFRQATRKLTDIDEHKRAALTRMFGSDSWEAKLYPEGDPDMFGVLPERRRELNPRGLERYVQSRLGQIFAKPRPRRYLP